MTSPILCAFCQSPHVIPNVKIMDTGQYATGQLSSNLGMLAPSSIWDKKPVNVKFLANICCSCGRVSMHIEDPAGTWRAYQEILASGRTAD